MKIKTLTLLSIIIFSIDCFSTNWEMGLRVFDSQGLPEAKYVTLYKDNGFYIEFYRGNYSSATLVNGVNGACDVLYCDLTNIDTNNPIWAPIEAGTYILMIDNNYCRFTFFDYDCSPPSGSCDFIISYQSGQFNLDEASWAVSSVSTFNWDKISGTFKQFKSDGLTSTGTVAIGQSSSFSDRYSPPFNFYVNQSQDYLFHSDTLIINSQKYYKWQDISDIKNFRVKNSGLSNFEIRANFNWTYSGITIKNNFTEYSAVNPDEDIIQFKDPWLIEYKDPAYGNHRRNRGMDGAIFWSRSSPFYPDYNTFFGGNSYKGVFLNQSGPPPWNPPYYSVKVPQAVQNLYLPHTGRYHNFYFKGWTGTEVQFQNSNALQTGVVFKDDIQGVDPVVSANLKGTNLSDDQKAYNTTSQRKFIKTPDGYLHSVYSSLGRVWYEQSNDNGASWFIISEQPLDDGEAKLPSIDYGYYDDPHGNNDVYWIVIVFQEKFGSGFKIRAKSFQRTQLGEYYLYQDQKDIVPYASESYSNNANPVLAIDVSGLITFVWERKSGGGQAGLYLSNSQVNSNGLQTPGTPSKLTGTNSSSANPSVTVTKSWFSGTTRHLVWQAPGVVNSTDIIYKTFEYSGSQSGTTNISNGNGYPSNYSPCISLANGKPVVSWTRYYGADTRKITGEQNELIRKRALVKVRGSNGWPSVCTELGDNVNFVNNNSVTSASEKAVFVWSQGTTPQSKWVRRSGGNYATIYNLSYSGIEHQVTSGADFDNMTAMVFNKKSTPFYLIKANTNFSADEGGEINKITNSEQVSYGRSGIINKSGVEFVFNTGDVVVADSLVQFTFIPDTLMFNSAEELNTASRTENFWLEERVDFYFSNLYYVIRQELADSVLTEQDQVNFKVELVKAQSGDVVGTFDNITYNKNNLEKYASIHYLVNTSGIQAGEYYLRLVTTVAGNAGYNLSNIQRDEFDLSKLNYVNVSFTGEGLPVSYELSQNYPNPFNPSTTIRYQLPKDGMVTLKVYDILGAEVATLVNEEKIAGKYEVNFNASMLASGVYIYRLSVNDPSTSSGQSLVNVKKMLLVK